jgi:sugar phosphate isomerase/epimerase
MQLGLFSISYGGLWGRAALDVRAFVRRAADLGCDAVMLAGKRPYLSPLDFDPAAVASLRDGLEAAKVTCAVVAAYTDLSPAAAAEVPFVERQIAYVESLCRTASALGAGVVRVFTAYESPGHSPHAAWQRVVTVLREVCDRAAAHRITIAVQNHHDVALHTDALLELLTDIGRPNCKLGFDAWSPALRGEGLYEAAKRALVDPPK